MLPDISMWTLCYPSPFPTSSISTTQSNSWAIYLWWLRIVDSIYYKRAPIVVGANIPPQKCSSKVSWLHHWVYCYKIPLAWGQPSSPLRATTMVSPHLQHPHSSVWFVYMYQLWQSPTSQLWLIRVRPNLNSESTRNEYSYQSGSLELWRRPWCWDAGSFKPLGIHQDQWNSGWLQNPSNTWSISC